MAAGFGADEATTGSTDLGSGTRSRLAAPSGLRPFGRAFCQAAERRGTAMAAQEVKIYYGYGPVISHSDTSANGCGGTLGSSSGGTFYDGARYLGTKAMYF
ncbi:MAG: hypothetical protein ACKPKO_56860 [Candidatus Fonsibacter sp.]